MYGRGFSHRTCLNSRERKEEIKNVQRWKRKAFKSPEINVDYTEYELGECKKCMDYCSPVNVSIRMKIYQKGSLTRIPIIQSPGAFVLEIYEVLPGF